MHDGTVHAAYEGVSLRGKRMGYTQAEHIDQAFKAMDQPEPRVAHRRPAECAPKERDFDIVCPWRRNYLLDAQEHK